MKSKFLTYAVGTLFTVLALAHADNLNSDADAVAGKLSLKDMQAAYSVPVNGPLYSAAPAWSWNNIDVVIVDYLTDSQSAAAFLPEGMTTLPIPGFAGFSAVKQIWAHYPNSSFGPYNEFFLVIPVLYKGQIGLYNPLIYVDRDSAMAGGREIGGWPKKMGEIKMEKTSNGYKLSFSRDGKALAAANMQIGDKLFSTPLPANEKVVLPFPYDMTFPLPEPTGVEQATIPMVTTTLKMIPGIGSENPTPALAQLVAGPWQLKGDFFGGVVLSVEHQGTEKDPLDKLPIRRIVGAMYMKGDMTLALKDMRVLENLLERKK